MEASYRASQSGGTRRSRWRGTIAATVALAGATFLLTRHAQIPGLQYLVAPWGLLAVWLWLQPLPFLRVVWPVGAYALVSMQIGIVSGQEAGDAVRFLLILLATLAAFFVRTMRVRPAWVLAPVVLQCILIALVSLALTVLQDDFIATTVRFMAIDNDWGDIYTHDGVYYRVQLIGNALIPLMFLIGLWLPEGRLRNVCCVAGLVGLTAAGNLTYFLVVGLAAMVRYRHWLVRPAVLWLLLVPATALVVGVLGELTQETLDRKFDGGDSSMGIRFDQVDVARRAVLERPTILVVGAGLGARFPDGRERDYSSYNYIELQSLLIAYKFGSLGMLLYLLTMTAAMSRALSRRGCLIFVFYMLSGLSNPYIFDTNQIVATMLLVSLFPARSGPTVRRPADNHGAPAGRPMSFGVTT